MNLVGNSWSMSFHLIGVCFGSFLFVPSSTKGLAENNLPLGRRISTLSIEERSGLWKMQNFFARLHLCRENCDLIHLTKFHRYFLWGDQFNDYKRHFVLAKPLWISGCFYARNSVTANEWAASEFCTIIFFREQKLRIRQNEVRQTVNASTFRNLNEVKKVKFRSLRSIKQWEL